MNVSIRTFKEQDWPSVSKIYEEGIATEIATFETEVPSFNIWDEKFIKKCRLVATYYNEVIGFAVLSQVSRRDVYKGVAEVTVYVAKNYRSKGIGKLLLESLIIESETEGFWTLQAGVFSENKPSIQVHEHCGFRIVGLREKIGKRDGIWHDNVLMERRSQVII